MPGIIAIFGAADAVNDVRKIAARISRTPALKTLELPIGSDALAVVGVGSLVARSPVAALDTQVYVAIHGYLSNRQELANRLGLETSAPDSLIIARGYERFGEGFFEKTDGSFNLLLVDRSDGATYLVSDCYGHLPLYHYTDQAGRVLIAPELKAFMECSWIKREVDWNGVADFLVMGQPWSTKTFLAGIHNLEPGTIVKWDGSGRQTSRYWRIPYNRRSGGDISADGLAAELNGVLEHSIRRLDAIPGKKALFLSGGFDSRILACYMRRLSGSSFDTLGMQLNGLPAIDSYSSTRVAKALGVEWKAIDYKVESQNAERLLDQHLEVHDGTWACSYFPQALPLDEMCSNYDFIVNGNNGNHIFGDYATRYLTEQMEMLSSGVDSEFFVQAKGDGIQRLLIFRMMTGTKDYCLPMLEGAFAKETLHSAVKSFDREFFARTDICGSDKYEFLALTQTGRRYGLFNPPLQDFYEGLNPFYHDRKLLTFSSSLPSEWKFSRTLDAHNMSTQFPDVFRVAKISGYQSFLRYSDNPVPPGKAVDDYYDGRVIFQTMLSKRIDAVLNDPRFVRRKWLNVPHIHSLWAGHKAGTVDATAPISTIVALDYFLRTFTASE